MWFIYPAQVIMISFLRYPTNELIFCIYVIPTTQQEPLTKEELKKWVNYALANDTLILFDAAYRNIQDPEIPTLFMKIKGAKMRH